MRITRQDMIDAVRNEEFELRPGYWFSDTGVEDANKLCPMCAVGATLRQVDKQSSNVDLDTLLSEHAGELYLDNEKYIEINITNGHYLAALSCYFESGDRSRDDLEQWIRTNIPEDAVEVVAG